MGQGRKLAAIMFTDIVGYTALMGSDEQQALDLLHENRQLHEACIKNHEGLLLKEMGDGILAHFDSALDAVQCAIEIQENTVNRVKGKLRIGIHLGDVIIEHHDVFGDGVNIASRLQSIADPGGIFISESVQKAIRSRMDIKVRYLCDVDLKNVGYPVRTYALRGNGLPETTADKIDELSYKATKSKFLKSPYNFILALSFILVFIALWWWLPQKKQDEIRLAILPVENLTTVEHADLMARGIHASIIDELSNISLMQVTSKTSSSKYGGMDMTIPEIARELQVDVLVESELTEMGDSVELKFRLIKAFPEEDQLWSKSYHKSTKEMLAIYGSLALEISKLMNIDLSTKNIQEFSQTRQVDPQAYQAYLTGMGYLYKLSKNGIDKALQYFNLSIAKDPDYAPAYLGVAFVWGVRRQQGFVSMKIAMRNSEIALSKALELDSTSLEVHYQLAVRNTWGLWKWVAAEKEFKRTLEINPNHAEARAYYAHYLNIMHRSDEAQIQIEEALKLKPNSALIQALYGMHLNHTKQYDKAIKLLMATLEEEPENVTALSTLWTIYHNSGMYEDALETAKLLYSAKHEDKVVDILINEYVEGDYSQAMRAVAEAYIAKKDTAYVTPWQIATLYTRANKPEEALHWLEEAYKEHDANMPYISCDPIFGNIEKKSRFQKLLKEMGLPQ